jgi:hypothetical protein
MTGFARRLGRCALSAGIDALPEQSSGDPGCYPQDGVADRACASAQASSSGSEGEDAINLIADRGS